MGRRLRIGLLLNRYTVPFWVAEVVEALASDVRVEIAQVILNGRHGSAMAAPRKLWQRLADNHLLYYRYERFERWRQRRHYDRYPDRDLHSLLAAVPALVAQPQGERFVQRFTAEDIAAIGNCELDVLLRFGFRILRGGILDCARLGIWSYHHGDNNQYRGSCPGFWEIYENSPVSGVTLQMLTESLDGGHVLARTDGRTESNSFVLNHRRLQMAGVRLLGDVLDRVVREDPSREEFLARFPPSSQPYRKRIYKHPTNLQMLRFLTANVAWGVLRRRFRPKRVEQWVVGVSRGPAFARGGEQIQPVRWLFPPPDRFLADPFGVIRDGRLWLFVEELDYRTGLGHISVIEVDDRGGFGEPVAVIREPHHLSFPFLFGEGEELYLLPEQRQNRRLDLYRAVEFPRRWEKCHTLMKGIECVDPVIIKRDGTWWLFLTRSTFGIGQDNLYLFYADDLFGEWVPHPCNPLRNGVRGARMAGGLQEVAGQLLRPAQNGANRYGGSIVLHEVRELTRESYAEVEVRELTTVDIGFPGNLATHTLNRVGEFNLVDGCRLIAPVS